jgi:hypothetical protein
MRTQPVESPQSTGPSMGSDGPFQINKKEMGSHLPVLMKLVPMTTGPILELGSGLYSTVYLHWACLPSRRPLVTYETHPEWWKNFTKTFQEDFHTVSMVEDWSTVDLSRPWSIAFVDCDGNRSDVVRRILHADYVVCHDTNNLGMRRWGMDPIKKWFTWRWDYNSPSGPRTSIFSNTHDLTGFSIP